MATKNAPKQKVYEKLSESINYCNSHHEPVQPLFESIVDDAITAQTRVHDYETRRLDMKSLFPVLLTSRLQGMVPSIPLGESALNHSPRDFLELWLKKWVAKFVKEWERLPSENIAKGKQSVTDVALLEMVSASGHAGNMESAIEWAVHHNLFMGAENVNGALLEEYIASKICQYGWIWCRGKVLTAIDFCNRKCTHMFQVKNKTNTENSSGKGFREERGATVWCRMRDKRLNGEIVTYWPALIEMVRKGSVGNQDIPDNLMNEDDYLKFVREVSERNPNLITGDEW